MFKTYIVTEENGQETGRRLVKCDEQLAHERQATIDAIAELEPGGTVQFIGGQYVMRGEDNPDLYYVDDVLCDYEGACNEVWEVVRDIEWIGA